MTLRRGQSPLTEFRACENVGQTVRQKEKSGSFAICAGTTRNISHTPDTRKVRTASELWCCNSATTVWDERLQPTDMRSRSEPTSKVDLKKSSSEGNNCA